jgi:uncharacterized cupin superfamily protein
MRRVSLSKPDLTYDPKDPEGFRSGLFRFGPQLGATQSGATLYELPPGQAVCPYHYEYGEEEWLLVLEGRPSLRTPDGTEQLEPSDVAFFPKGPGGAHQISNGTDSTVRVLMWSTVVYPTATAYPDSDKVGIWTGNAAEDLLAPRSSKVDYFHGEAHDR